jgi:DnaD/phage-associated family protein
MTSIQWWRSWHGAPTDHKWAVIAARAGVKVGIVSAVAWALMDHASQANPRGSVSDFDTEVYAVYSGFDEAEIIAVIKAMTDKGIITEGKLTNWTKRQPQREDDSRERVRQWREMKRNVTQSNAKKSPDTDKDTDKDINTTTGGIFQSYEANIGPLVQKVSEDIKGLIEDYPQEWITESFEIAAVQNKRNLAYCKAILKRWQAEGKDDGTLPKKNGTRKPSRAEPAGFAAIREYMEEQANGNV